MRERYWEAEEKSFRHVGRGGLEHCSEPSDQPPQSLTLKSPSSRFTSHRELFRRSLAQRPGRELRRHLRPAPWARGWRAQTLERQWLAETDPEGRGRRGGGRGRRSAPLRLGCHVPPGEGRFPAALHSLRPPDPPQGLH